jgi:LacI family transcriptional regulator
VNQNAAPTLSDVAAHAGVSLATASRALNGSTRQVRPDLKARVLASATALGYSVNSQAQAVAKGTSTTVALVVGDIADPYFSSIAAGVVRGAREHGLSVTLTGLEASAVQEDSGQEAALIAALRAQRPRAVIVAAGRETDAGWEAFSHLNALTVIGPDIPGIRSVAVANRDGAAALATGLRGLGYSDFTIVAGDVRLSTVSERIGGFVSMAPGSRIVEAAFSRDGGYRAMAGLLAAGARPECVFAVTDVMAIGVVGAIKDAGLTPGEDIAVAGFDDVPILRDLTPRLTTVALPLEEIGERALALAVSDASDPRLSEPIVGEVRIRESTPPRA